MPRSDPLVKYGIIAVVIFNDRLVDIVEQYLEKGSKVYLEGALQTRKWTDQSGVEKYSTEIVLQRFRGEIIMLDRASRDDDDERPATTGRPALAKGYSGADLDDEIPFAPMKD